MGKNLPRRPRRRTGESASAPKLTPGAGQGLQGMLSHILDLASSLPGPKTKSLRSEAWHEGLGDVKRMIPPVFFESQGAVPPKFIVTAVFRKGEVHLTCTDRGEVYKVFVDSTASMPPAGCSCEASSGERPCRHVSAAVTFLRRELHDPESEFRRQVNEERFAPGTPDRTSFKFDSDNKTVQQLEQLLLSVRRLDAAIEFGLPDAMEATHERVVWNVRASKGTIDLEPIVQQQKKRGGGFTKGRKVSLERLKHDKGLVLSNADQEVIDQIQLVNQPYSYRTSWDLNGLVAIERLVGEPNVLLNDLPCLVKERAYFIYLTLVNGRLSFRLSDETGRVIDGETVGSEGHMVTVDAMSPTIWYGTLVPGMLKVIQSLTKTPSLGLDHRERVVQLARQLQKSYSVLIDDSLGGPVVQETPKQAVLLRSRPDGTLDYGLRVRLGDGPLMRPGCPPAIRADQADGKPIQRRRDLVAETQQAGKIAAKLGIRADAANAWTGKIDDFMAGLHLLEKLQDNTDEIEVLWDKTSEKPLTVLGRLSSKNVRVDITSKRNWFGISGQCDFGNQSMPLDQVLQNLSHSNEDSIQGDFVRIGDGQWARVSQDLRASLLKLRDATHSDRKTLTLDATAAPAIRELMNGDVEVNATKNWHQCLARLHRAETIDPVVPKGLQAELRDYQVEGYKWLRRLAEWGVGGVLADDMGLGKTIQTLAVLLDRMNEGPALVVAPTSVGFNWAREAEKFAPALNVHLYRETDRQEFLSGIGPGDLVVCSYGLALRDEKALSGVAWGTVVLDEAQAVKNSRSKTSLALSNLKSKWTVALTGTPVENHLGELWSLFHLVSPGVFGGWEQFRKRYATAIEKHDDEDARISLSHRLKPFILRRSKSQVLTELPPRTEMTMYVDLSPEERDQYDRVRLSAIGEIDSIASLPQIQDQRFKLLALLTRLRQFACHPGIVNKQWTGSSAKLDQLCETIDGLKEEGHRALVFSQFTEHLALIRKAFEERGVTYEYLDGSTPAAARQERVDDFQNGNANVFLISLKAGGTGLNLTAADYVIHMDPWWNPAVEDQATDRAHRIGQEKPVMVYRIVARGTIEEEILSLHETKRDLVDGVLAGTAAAAKLSNVDLLMMLRRQAE